MRVRVSLPDDDVRFLDEYAMEQGLGSRSAAVHRAVRLLFISQLEASYAAAWQEFDADGEADTWEAAMW